MGLVMFDLAAAEDDRRFSPFCWRIRMALAHKGLEAEVRPWRFTEKAALAALGQEKVPVLLDGAEAIGDSWTIAEYLEANWPDRPSLFGGEAGRPLTRFAVAWTETVLQAQMLRLLALDIWRHLAEADRAYYRSSREARFGTTLEAFCDGREQRLEAFRGSLTPLRQLLRQQPFLGGAAPLYADYVVFGAFQWARCISELQLLSDDDPVAEWRGRLLALHGGLAGSALGYPC